MAMGARSQAAKTYLERQLEEFPGAGVDSLVKHALLALQVRPATSRPNTNLRYSQGGSEFEPFLSLLTMRSEAPQTHSFYKQHSSHNLLLSVTEAIHRL
jgi:hypothetical protein